MKRIRKAVFGAATSGLATGIAFLAKAAMDGAVNGDDVGQAVAAAIAGAVATFGVVRQVRNYGGTNSVGSDPVGGSTLVR